MNTKLYEETACSFGIHSVIENQKGVVVALDRAQVFWWFMKPCPIPNEGFLHRTAVFFWLHVYEFINAMIQSDSDKGSNSFCFSCY